MNKKIKNYILLLLIIFITCITALYIFSWCKQYKNVKLETPVIVSVLPEVKYNNLDSVLQERSFLALYMCTSRESICRSFENKFKNLIEQYNLNDEIVYLNLGSSNVENDILNKIYNKYKHEDLIKKINNYPTIFLINEGKIIDLISLNKDNIISISSVKEFLEEYDFIND